MFFDFHSHHSPYPWRILMNSATSNLIILTAEVNGDKIVGTAVDSDIKVLFAVAASEVNQRLFLPEANLVVTGKFQLGREICSIGISIKSIFAIVSLPSTVASEVAAPVDVTASGAATKKRKSTTTRSKKKTATELIAA
jgi:hypothetical protein